VNQASKVVIAGFDGQHFAWRGSRSVVLAPDTVVGAGAVVIRDTESSKVYVSTSSLVSEPRITQVLRSPATTPSL
jgi:hypothetical protein